jgi:hypothetical protein
VLDCSFRALVSCRRAFALAATLLIGATAAHAQSTCNSATPIAIGATFNGSNASSAGDGQTGLCAPTARSVWHTITPTMTGNHTISLCGSSFNSVASLYSACSSPLPTVLACDDDSCLDDAVLVYPLTAGTTYFLRVATQGAGPGGAYTVRVVGPATLPTNDICGAARTLTLNVPEAATTAGAGGTPISGCAALDNADTWFVFTAPQAGVYLAQVCSPVFTPVLSVHASCFGGPSLQCNTGAQLLACTPGQAGAALAIPVSTPGLQRLRVAAPRGAQGEFSLAVYAPRPNDLCADAASLSLALPYAGSTTPALTTDAAVACTASGLDAWHVFVPVAGGTYVFDTCSSPSFPTVLSVHSACPESPGSTVLACSTSGCSGVPSGARLTVNLLPGVPYYVRVAGRGSPAAFGTYTLTTSVVAPANDECSAALTITEGAVTLASTLGATGTDITSCGTSDSRDVWFAFTPPASGAYEFSTCGSQLAATLALYTSCGSAPLACAEPSTTFCGPNLQGGSLSANLSAGLTYRLRIAGLGQDTGPVTLAVTRAPGPRDACASATALTQGADIAGTLTGATGSALTSCGQADAPDAWFTFTPNATRFYRFSSCGSAQPVALSLFTACPPSAEIACTTTQPGLCSPTQPGAALSTLLRAGVTYRLRVLRTDAGVGGAFRVRVDPAAPANDACSAPQTLPLGVATLGANAGASADGSGSCGTGDGPDVWFAFTPAQPGWYRLDTCDTGTLDTVLDLRSDCAAAPLACSDDSPQCSAGRSRVIVRLTGGQTVLARVAGKAGAQGSFTITASVSQPPNDTCTQATPIADGAFVFDTLGASTDSAFIDGLCASALGFNLLAADVWFRYTAPATATVDVSTCGATFDTALLVSSGACPTGVYSVIACNDSAICPADPAAVTTQARASFSAVAGQTYLIRVGSRFGATGSGVLSVGRLVSCRCDFDASGTLTVDDIFVFLNAWFAADPRTDFDASGVRNVDDIFIFLNCFFQRPAGC